MVPNHFSSFVILTPTGEESQKLVENSPEAGMFRFAQHDNCVSAISAIV